MRGGCLFYGENVCHNCGKTLSCDLYLERRGNQVCRLSIIKAVCIVTLSILFTVIKKNVQFKSYSHGYLYKGLVLVVMDI